MIKVENIDVWGFEHAIRGMRNPMNSWDKSDSGNGCCKATHNKKFLLCKECPFEVWDRDVCNPYFQIGENDLDLMRRLYKAGSEHRKYLRQVFVSMDITCNHIFWAEFDTYKVGVTRNSCSKMHKIHAKGFSADDFSHEGIDEVSGIAQVHFEETIKVLEHLRNAYNNTHEKKYWRAMIELLPMGYNLKATITMNYENVVTIIKQRTGHKLDEWNDFVTVLKKLPYIAEITGEGNDVH